MGGDFRELFRTHWIWQEGILVSGKKKENGVIYYFSPINSEFFNVAFPVGDSPKELDLSSIEPEFFKNQRAPSFYLTEDVQKKGYIEFLIRNGYSFAGGDTYMVLDKSGYQKKPANSKIVQITPKNFPDYYSVLSVVFSDFSGNEKYLEICKKSLSGKITSSAFSDFKSELYLIYDSGRPASGAGIFYSTKGNFAYLHDAGTLKKFRGRGYQTDLIRHRVNKALDLGISRIYSIVELGSQSWKNMIKNGFMQAHLAYIVAKKK